MKHAILCALLAILGLYRTVRAEAGEPPGWREAWHEQGLNVGATHRTDYLSNLGGGLRRGSASLSHTEAHLAINGERWLGWEGASALLTYHFSSGAKFNRDYVGGQSGVDNIEVRESTGQVFDAWFQQEVLDGKFSLLAGLYHVDSEFYVTDTSGVLTQPAYGMANEVAQSGRTGPPIYPMAALSLRLKYRSVDNYAQVAVSDGVPGDPQRPRGTHVHLGRGEGAFWIAEAGWLAASDTACTDCENFGKLAVGAWRYTARFGDFSGSERHSSQGIYLLGERFLYRPDPVSGESLAGFVRFGTASPEVNAMNWSGSAGLRWRGGLQGRPNDVAAIAVTVNHAGKPFLGSGNFRSRETDLELTYRIEVLSWLALQPVLHFIHAPGFDPALRNARVMGARVELRF